MKNWVPEYAWIPLSLHVQSWKKSAYSTGIRWLSTVSFSLLQMWLPYPHTDSLLIGHFSSSLPTSDRPLNLLYPDLRVTFLTRISSRLFPPSQSGRSVAPTTALFPHHGITGGDRGPSQGSYRPAHGQCLHSGNRRVWEIAQIFLWPGSSWRVEFYLSSGHLNCSLLISRVLLLCISMLLLT